MTHYFKIFMLLLLFTACKHKTDSSIKKKVLIEQNTNEIDVLKNDFNVFFKKFSKDSIFQKESLNDVVNFYQYDDNDSLEVSATPKKELSYKDFSIDTLAYKKESNKYRVIKEYKKDSVIYNLAGIDNGIYVLYVFKKNKINDWKLTSVHNYSN